MDKPLDERRAHRLLTLAASASVATALILIVVKSVAWVLTGSVSLLASLIDSIMDSLASLMNFVAIRYSLVPADGEHRFGHGKAEALAGLGQSLLIAGSALYLLREAVLKLLDPRPIEATGLGVGVMVFSIVLTAVLLTVQKYVVRRTGSTAIDADSLHYLSDLAVNAGIILALVLSGWGFIEADGLVGLFIALYILRSAGRIGWDSVQLLLDRELPGEVREVIAAVVAGHPLALGFHDLRTRQSGRTRFIQLHVDMDERLSLRAAHDLGERIRAEIVARYPTAEVIIHHDPVPAGPRVPINERTGPPRRGSEEAPVRIVADENMPALEPFAARGAVTRVDGRTLTRDQLQDADVLLVRSVTHVDRALLEGTPVRFVGSATIGTDHIDLAALDRLGIAFAHAPGCNARAVAEYVLQALLLACQRQDRTLRESRVGVIGLGNVGARVATWLDALGVTVIGCDPPLARAGADAPVPLASLEAVLDADLITLHVPLTRQGNDATFHLLDERRLARLGPRQTLISTCRGAVIDNAALAARLARGQGPLTILDVWENEPRPDPALLKRVWLGSPHVAGYSVEGKWRGTAMLYDAWCRWRGELAPEATPPMGGEVLEVPIHDEADLLALLRRAYRLDDDDARLRDALAGTDPGAAFDGLRRNYPPRHELPYWRHRGEVAAAFKPLIKHLFTLR